MSSPREAVYDVLMAKRERTVPTPETAVVPSSVQTATAWERYEAQNAAANAAYVGSHR